MGKSPDHSGPPSLSQYELWALEKLRTGFATHRSIPARNLNTLNLKLNFYRLASFCKHECVCQHRKQKRRKEKQQLRLITFIRHQPVFLPQLDQGDLYQNSDTMREEWMAATWEISCSSAESSRSSQRACYLISPGLRCVTWARFIDRGRD